MQGGWTKIVFVIRARVFLVDGLALGGQTADVVGDEHPEVRLALYEELAADAGELVRAVPGHIEGELFDVLPVDEPYLYVGAHASSSSPDLNFSWEATHSCASTSWRTPRKVG